MKLNAEGIKELREYILELLETVPEGERIKLDTKLLDDLIFFKGKNQQGEVIKVPVWTGPFLRKLDLSKLSFKNVFFGIGDEIFNFTGKNMKVMMDAETDKRFKKIKYFNVVDYVPPMPGNSVVEHMENMIDFSYTNIKINFNEIYGNAIEHTNFSGIDLSASNAFAILWAYKCDFSNTNVNFDFSLNDIDLGLNCCDLSFNNFEGQNIEAKLFVNNPEICYTNGFNNCVWWGTGINVINLEKDSSKELASLIKNDSLNGCYVNGVYIKCIEERKAIASQKHNEYIKYQTSIKAKVGDQIRKLKK